MHKHRCAQKCNVLSDKFTPHLGTLIELLTGTRWSRTDSLVRPHYKGFRMKRADICISAELYFSPAVKSVKTSDGLLPAALIQIPMTVRFQFWYWFRLEYGPADTGVDTDSNSDSTYEIVHRFRFWFQFQFRNRNCLITGENVSLISGTDTTGEKCL